MGMLDFLKGLKQVSDDDQEYTGDEGGLTMRGALADFAGRTIDIAERIREALQPTVSEVAAARKMLSPADLKKLRDLREEVAKRLTVELSTENPPNEVLELCSQCFEFAGELSDRYGEKIESFLPVENVIVMALELGARAEDWYIRIAKLKMSEETYRRMKGAPNPTEDAKTTYHS